MPCPTHHKAVAFDVVTPVGRVRCEYGREDIFFCFVQTEATGRHFRCESHFFLSSKAPVELRAQHQASHRIGALKTEAHALEGRYHNQWSLRLARLC